MNTQTTIGLTKYTLLNGHIIYTLEQEYEKLRSCVLDREAANEDSTVAMRWFVFYGRKLKQARKLKSLLVSKA